MPHLPPCPWQLGAASGWVGLRSSLWPNFSATLWAVPTRHRTPPPRPSSPTGVGTRPGWGAVGAHRQEGVAYFLGPNVGDCSLELLWASPSEARSPFFDPGRSLLRGGEPVLGGGLSPDLGPPPEFFLLH